MLKMHILGIRSIFKIPLHNCIIVIPENNMELESVRITEYLSSQKDLGVLAFPKETLDNGRTNVGARTHHTMKIQMIEFLRRLIAEGLIFFSKDFVQTTKNNGNTKDNKTKVEDQLLGFKKVIEPSKVPGRKASIKFTGKSSSMCDDTVMVLAINAWMNRSFLSLNREMLQA
jgi:hypothetical protein